MAFFKLDRVILTHSSPPLISVLLVDDSSVIRSALGQILKSAPLIGIAGSVPNGGIGVQVAKNKQPGIVILDVETPVMDGITALPEILKVSPKSKVIMFSSLTEKGASITIKALSLGAMECLAKPSASEPLKNGDHFKETLLRTIKDLSGKAAVPHTAPSKNEAKAKPVSLLSGNFALHDDPMAYKGKPALLAIGSSTGGPNALFEVVKHFKDFDIPIVLTQHMPATFTKILAEHISQKTGVEASEGHNGMALENGKVYVAPGDYHMTFVKDGTRVLIETNQNPPINFCRPSVDPMFSSAVEIFGSRVLGVMLTGMGADGLDSARELVKSHGRLIAQDEETSVVWGMPGAVAKDGLCSHVLPLAEIGPWVRRAVIK